MTFQTIQEYLDGNNLDITIFTCGKYEVILKKNMYSCYHNVNMNLEREPLRTDYEINIFDQGAGKGLIIMGKDGFFLEFVHNMSIIRLVDNNKIVQEIENSSV